jgi:hypothetical protein
MCFCGQLGCYRSRDQKQKQGGKEKHMYIYLEREQQEDVFTKSFKWIGQGKVLFFRAFYGVFRLMFMVSMGE